MKEHLVAYDWDGKPIAVIEMWLEEQTDTESVVVTLHSRVARI